MLMSSLVMRAFFVITCNEIESMVEVCVMQYI